MTISLDEVLDARQRLEDTRASGRVLPAANLLGGRGDQIWYVFNVVAPYFLMAMAP